MLSKVKATFMSRTEKRFPKAGFISQFHYMSKGRYIIATLDNDDVQRTPGMVYDLYVDVREPEVLFKSRKKKSIFSALLIVLALMCYGCGYESDEHPVVAKATLIGKYGDQEFKCKSIVDFPQMLFEDKNGVEFDVIFNTSEQLYSDNYVASLVVEKNGVKKAKKKLKTYGFKSTIDDDNILTIEAGDIDNSQTLYKLSNAIVDISEYYRVAIKPVKNNNLDFVAIRLNVNYKDNVLFSKSDTFFFSYSDLAEGTESLDYISQLMEMSEKYKWRLELAKVIDKETYSKCENNQLSMKDMNVFISTVNRELDKINLLGLRKFKLDKKGQLVAVYGDSVKAYYFIYRSYEGAISFRLDEVTAENS